MECTTLAIAESSSGNLASSRILPFLSRVAVPAAFLKISADNEIHSRTHTWVSRLKRSRILCAWSPSPCDLGDVHHLSRSNLLSWRNRIGVFQSTVFRHDPFADPIIRRLTVQLNVFALLLSSDLLSVMSGPQNFCMNYGFIPAYLLVPFTFSRL